KEEYILTRKQSTNFTKRNKKNKSKLSKQTNRRPFKDFNFFNNMSIGMKYLLMFLFSVLLFIGATIIVYTQLSAAKKDVQTIISHNDIANLMTEMALLVEQQDSSISAYSLAGTMRHVDDYKEMESELTNIFNTLDTVFTDGDEELTYGAIKMNSESIT